jgi:cytochrome c oxidase subunit 2
MDPGFHGSCPPHRRRVDAAGRRFGLRPGCGPERRRRSVPLGLVAAGIALFLSGCARHPQSALAPAGPVARLEFGLMGEGLWIMVGVFAVVAALLLTVIVRFMARPGQQRPLPEQVEGNTYLEILWTVLPVLLLVMLIVPTVRATYALSTPQPKALQVRVVGHQFWWEFDYPQLHIKTADQLHIPAGQPVNLSITSADVIHSFWVPRLAGKQAAVPGHTGFLWLKADHPGVYDGQCAEFCGTSHSLMHFQVIAQTPAAFSAWVRMMQHPVDTPATPLARQGAALFVSEGCFTCHSIAGTPYTSGTLGPSLTALGTHTILAAGVFTNTPQHLAQWLADPPAIMPGVIMPDFHLSKAQIAALVAYLEGLH